MKDKHLLSDARELISPLQSFTGARIALGHRGGSMPLNANLEFQLAHAQARDAVNIPLDFPQLAQHLDTEDILHVQSAVENHAEYLQRPDKGRLLAASSLSTLHSAFKGNADIALIIADGLSSKAISAHAPELVNQLLPCIKENRLTLAPLCLVKYGRVAIGDPIGECLNAKMSIVLIGERPGLSSPDSMGIYFTYQPKSGNTDAQRNCISNIHRHGLDYVSALEKLMFLITQAQQLKLSGVQLKDQTDSAEATLNQSNRNFLLD